MTDTATKSVETNGKAAHLAACAKAKAEAAERRAARRANHAMRLRHAARDRLYRVQQHEARNESRRLEASVARILAKAGKGVGVDALAAASPTVSSPWDWRQSIEATIPRALTDAEYDLAVASIVFFTCGKADDIGTIRDADRTEFHAAGLFETMRGDRAVADVDRAFAVATAHGFETLALRLAA